MAAIAALVMTVFLLAALWRAGIFPGGTEAKVASIVRQIKAEERASSGGINRWRFSLPGPLARLVDRVFPRNWQGDYYYRQELTKLGTNAGPFLIGVVAGDGSVAARRVCGLALGDMNLRDAVPVLIRMLQRDHDAEVRSAMAESLGCLRDTNAVPFLVDVMKKDNSPSVRESGARALGEMRARWTTPEVVAALLSETNRTTKVGMIAALKALGDVRAVPVLVEHLNLGESKESDPEGPSAAYSYELYSVSEIRAEAAAALGEIGGDAALEALVGRLEKESDTRTGEAICAALGAMRDPRAVPPLLSQLEAGGGFKEAAIEALGLIGDAKVRLELLHLLDEREADLRAKAVEALGRIGDAQCADRLKQLLERDPAESVRAATCSALALVGDPSVRDAIAGALPQLKDNQSAAIWALGHLGDSNQISVLARHLEAADRESRFAAAYALAEIGGPEAVEALQGHLTDKDEYARHGKACALAMMGNSSGLATVRNGLKAENEWQRFSSAIALVRVGDVVVAEELAPMLNDSREVLRAFAEDLIAARTTAGLRTLLQAEDRDFRNYAARAFAFFKDPAAIPALRRACADPDVEVREAAHLSLQRIERDTPGEPLLLRAE